MSPLKSAASLLAVGAVAFGCGYLAATRGPLAPREPAAAAVVAEAPQPSTYWRERASFFDTLGTRASVVMIGDSITDGAEWGEMFPGATMANRGIDEDTTVGVLRRMAGIEAVHAAKAFVMIGINDFAREGRSVDAVFADYRRIVSRLEKGGTKVFIQSTLACNAALAGWISCAAIQQSIRELNRRLATLASGDVAFIDINAALAGDGGLKPEYTYDGVHLNGEGYRAWKREISRFVLNG